MVDFIKNNKKMVKKWVVDPTATILFSNPAFAAFETMFVGMPNETSINARILYTGLTYLGLGELYAKGMDSSRKHFNIKMHGPDKTINDFIFFHDTVYSMMYSLAVSPIFYAASGGKDLKEILTGTGTAIGLAAISGGAGGYFIDAYRDLTGIEESTRLPQRIKESDDKSKLGIAGIVAVASFATTALIYPLNNYINSTSNSSQIVQVEKK